MARKRIRNEQWKRLKDMLPGKTTDSGGTAKNNRLFLEAVLWIGRTRLPWRDLPPELGNWHATFTRFSRWRKKGVWQRVIAAVSEDAELQALLIHSTAAWPRYYAAEATKKQGVRSSRC